MGEITHPDVQNAIQSVKKACDNQSTQLGIFGVSAENVTPYKALGFTLLTMGVDTIFLQSAATKELETLRNA